MRSSAGSDQTYAGGDEIEFTVTFNEKVTVDTEDGVPSIDITVGVAKQTAQYDRGSGTTELVFSHIVVMGSPSDIAAFQLGNTTRPGRYGGDDTDGVSVEAGKIRLNGGLMTSSSGDRVDLDHPALGTQSSHKVDGTRPMLDSRPVANGDTLELVYSETLDGNAEPPTSAFTVWVNRATRNVTDVSLSGSTVTLTLGSALSAGDSASVKYYFDTTYLQDLQGNLAYPVVPTSVLNATPETSVADPGGPDISSLAIGSDPGSDGVYAGTDTIEVTATFSDNVTVDATNGTPALQLMVGKAIRTATYTGGSGTSTLTFGYTVAQGYPPRVANYDNFHTDHTTAGGDEDTDGLSIAAGRISLNGATIRNATDLDADLEHDGLAVQPGHKVDGVFPTADGRPEVDGTTLKYSYVETLDMSSAPTAAPYEVVGDGSASWAVSDAPLSGSTITLTLGSALEHDDRAWLRYQPGSSPIRDLVGNPAKRLYNVFVENLMPVPPPPAIDPLAASVDSITIGSDPGTDQTYAGGEAIDVVLNYDKSVTVDTTNGTPSIEIEVGRSRKTASYVSGSGSSALTFRYTVVTGLPRNFIGILRLLGYQTPPAGDEDDDGIRVPAGNVALKGSVIEDDENRAANVPHPKLPTQAGHRVDGVQPYVESDDDGSADGDSIRVTYSESLDAGEVNPAGFKVVVDGVERTVSEATVQGAKVILTLDSPVTEDDEVMLGYNPGIVPVRDPAGNAAYDQSVEVQSTDDDDVGGNTGGGGGGSGGGGGGTENEDDDDGEGGGGGGSGGGGSGGGSGGLAPRAAFTQDAECGADGLCRAKTETPVTFTDTSTGNAAQRNWDFGDGNTAGSQKTDHAWMEPGFYKVTLNVRSGSMESMETRMFLVEPVNPAGTCEVDGETLCLQDARYSLEAEWWNPEGDGGAAKVVHAGTNDSALLRFFNRDNWEVLIKVLDGCAVNGHMWVFGASTTNLGYSIRVTDTVTGEVKEYRNEAGLPAPAIADVTAFADGCTGGANPANQ